MSWQEALAAHWGLTTPLERLDGEYDLNFRAGNHILKVMRQGCDPALVEVQIAALARIAEAAPTCPCPASCRPPPAPVTRWSRAASSGSRPPARAPPTPISALTAHR